MKKYQKSIKSLEEHLIRIIKYLTLNKLVLIIAFLFFANNAFSLSNNKKFVIAKYKYILQIDDLLNRKNIDSIFIDKVKVSLDSLELNISNFKLRRQDVLLVRIFINRTRLIIANFHKVNFYSLETYPDAFLEAKQLDLYRDYALASAQIQARFQRKYKKVKI